MKRRIAAVMLGLAVGCWCSAPAQGSTEGQKKKAEPHLTLPAADLDQVIGVYRDKGDPDTPISVYRVGDRIYTEGERSPKVELFAVAKDRYIADEGFAEFDFVRDASGKVTGFTSKGSGKAGPVLERVEETPRKLNHFREYTKQDVMIPARDGVKLHLVIFRPAGSESGGEALPFLMERTPYGVDGNTSDRVNAMKPDWRRADTSSSFATSVEGISPKGIS